MAHVPVVTSPAAFHREVVILLNASIQKFGRRPKKINVGLSTLVLKGNDSDGPAALR